MRIGIKNSNWQLVTDLKQFIRFIKNHIIVDDDVDDVARLFRFSLSLALLFVLFEFRSDFAYFIFL